MNPHVRNASVPGWTTTLASLSVAGACTLISPGSAAASASREVKISFESVPIASWWNYRFATRYSGKERLLKVSTGDGGCPPNVPASIPTD